MYVLVVNFCNGFNVPWGMLYLYCQENNTMVLCIVCNSQRLVQDLNPNPMKTSRLRCLWPVHSTQMRDLPSTWIQVHHTTYDPPNHSEGIWMNWVFQSTMWEPRGLPLSRISASQFVCARSRCSPSKEAMIVEGPLFTRLHTNLNQVEDEATP